MSQFNFTNSRLNSDKNELSIKNILSNISEVTLWRYYLNTDFKLGVPIKAPYRPDRNPSFGIYMKPNGRVGAKDLAGHFTGDIFSYLGLVFGISLFEVCKKINYDFDLNLYYDNIDTYKPTLTNSIPLTKKQIKKLDRQGETVISESNKIQIKVRPYEESDLKYWRDYGISKNTLENYNVYCANTIYCNKKLCYNRTIANPAYVYYFPKSTHVKIYYPMQTGYRFIGNVNNYEDIQGYYQLDIKSNKDNKILILTKSLKDVMLLKEFGIDAVAIHGEKHRFHEDFIRHIKKYYRNIISLYDRDKSGMEGAKYLWREFKIPAIFINKYFQTKDISDLYKTYGSDVTQEFLINNKLI